MKKLIGRGRLPKPENLAKLTPEQLRNILHRFGIDGTEIRNQMLREQSQLASQISKLHRQGIKPDDTMRRQLHGRIKTLNKTLMRRMTGKAITQFQAERTRIQEEDNLSKRIWIWICCFKRSCESCIRRHNVVKSFNEWEKFGLPKSDNLVCDGNCNCQIYMREDILDMKIEKSPDDLSNLRTRQRSVKESKEISEQLRYTEPIEI